MDSYIVRILRRYNADRDNTAQLAGVVEMVEEGGRRQAFHSPDELWAILGGADGANTPEDGKATTNNDG